MRVLPLLSTLILKVYLFIACGFVLSRISAARGEKIVQVLVGFALNVLIPLYMVLSLWSTAVPFSRAADVMLAAALVVFAGAAFALAWAALRGFPFRERCLPVVFMNSAYLAIPVNTVLWGGDGAVYAILYNIVVTVLTFTVGVWWACRERPFASIAALPVLYGVGLGLLLRRVVPSVPPLAAAANGWVSMAALPAMLLFVGYRLGSIRRDIFGEAFVGVMLRMAGGAAAAAAAVFLFGLTGTAAKVCIMSSAMPAAVYSYLLTERFEGDTSFAVAAVFLGTAVSFVTIPLLGYLL